MSIQTKTIVIKINDKYFLQSPSPKVTIGSNFFAPSNINRIYGLYVLPNNPVINPAGSINVFNNLITSLVGLPNSPKLVSLFKRIDATFVVDIMIKAKLRTRFVSENLLNYYYLDVIINSPTALMSIVDSIKSLPGIDFVYVRGELSVFETPRKRPFVGLGLTDTFEAIQGEAIENLPKPTLSLEKKSEILPIVNTKLVNDMAKFEEMKPDENIDQSKLIIPPNPENPKHIPTTVIPINDKIKSLFSYCGVGSENIEPGKNITVIDFERGWNFVQNDNLLYPNLASSPVHGGGHNHTSHKLHGQKTLNILFGKQTLSTQIDGLCKGANAKIASAWFGPGLSDKQPESALVKTLVNSGIIEGDIVLIEVQIDRWFPNLPIEIESAMYAVMKVGVQAGYIIVEAAANGGHPLDTINNAIHATSQTTSIMTTENPPTDMSQNRLGTGSIMVGGRKANLWKDKTLNHGDRIDYYCFAELSSTSSTATFNLTSLASAITAALVARFQSQALNSIAMGGINRRLTISEIKTLLKSIPYPDSTPSTLSIPTNFKQFLINNQIPTLSTVSILNP
jgi:hypothetical protein